MVEEMRSIPLLRGKASPTSMVDHYGTAGFREPHYAMDLSRPYTIFINISEEDPMPIQINSLKSISL
jgi:hypothetical protein